MVKTIKSQNHLNSPGTEMGVIRMTREKMGIVLRNDPGGLGIGFGLKSCVLQSEN